MSSNSRRKYATKVAIERAVRDALAAVPDHHTATRADFHRLLRHVHRSDLLRAASFGGRSGAVGCGEIVAGLVSLANFDWLRPVEDWEPTGVNPMPRFSSLASHLLAAYPVPAFMTSVWLKGQTPEARKQQGWYNHIGAGRNIRKADLPLPYTKMMAHHFLQAPDHLTVEQALRWGQIRGLGGSKEVAMAVALTRLGRSFEAEDFWHTIVHFLVNHPELDLAQIGPVVEYLHHQKFAPQEVCLDEKELTNLGPPQQRPRGPRALGAA